MNDIIRKDLSELSNMQVALSVVEASMLRFRVKQWKQDFEILAILALLGDKFKEDLRDMPVEIISIILGAGDFIGKAKSISELAVLFKKSLKMKLQT